MSEKPLLGADWTDKQRATLARMTEDVCGVRHCWHFTGGTADDGTRSTFEQCCHCGRRRWFCDGVFTYKSHRLETCGPHHPSAGAGTVQFREGAMLSASSRGGDALTDEQLNSIGDDPIDSWNGWK